LASARSIQMTTPKQKWIQRQFKLGRKEISSGRRKQIKSENKLELN